METSGDLVEARGWAAIQERVRAGEQDDLYPYAQELRFGR